MSSEHSHRSHKKDKKHKRRRSHSHDAKEPDDKCDESGSSRSKSKRSEEFEIDSNSKLTDEQIKKHEAESDPPVAVVEKVSSANEWESVQLGSDERKEKFLKLMGAKKKEHHGRFVIGDPNHKTHLVKPDTNLEGKLEDQFKHSMAETLQKSNKHMGLGCHEGGGVPSSSWGSKSKKFDQEGNLSETPPDPKLSAKEAYKMKFVHASSD